MAKLNPYLMFNGNCREAMEFYHSVLDGKLDIMPYGESPMGANLPDEQKNRVMHSALMSENITLMGSDSGVDDVIKSGDSVVLCLICETPEEIKDLFQKLSEGGNVTRELKEEFFGTYGELTDKFGFKWIFQQGGETPKQEDNN